VNFINYFFEIVIPQVLEYFKENAKDISSFLLLEVLLKNKNYEKNIQKLFEMSEEISNKYIVSGYGVYEENSYISKLIEYKTSGKLIGES